MSTIWKVVAPTKQDRLNKAPEIDNLFGSQLPHRLETK